MLSSISELSLLFLGPALLLAAPSVMAMGGAEAATLQESPESVELHFTGFHGQSFAIPEGLRWFDVLSTPRAQLNCEIHQDTGSPHITLFSVATSEGSEVLIQSARIEAGAEEGRTEAPVSPVVEVDGARLVDDVYEASGIYVEAGEHTVRVGTNDFLVVISLPAPGVIDLQQLAIRGESIKDSLPGGLLGRTADKHWAAESDDIIDIAARVRLSGAWATDDDSSRFVPDQPAYLPRRFAQAPAKLGAALAGLSDAAKAVRANIMRRPVSDP